MEKTLITHDTKMKRCKGKTCHGIRCKLKTTNKLCHLHRTQIIEEITCAICLEVVVNKLNVGCSHSFCKKCIYPWLYKNRTCPCCRQIVDNNVIVIARNHGILKHKINIINILRFDISQLNFDDYCKIAELVNPHELVPVSTWNEIYDNFTPEVKEIIDTLEVERIRGIVDYGKLRGDFVTLY